VQSGRNVQQRRWALLLGLIGGALLLSACAPAGTQAPLALPADQPSLLFFYTEG